MSINAVSSSAAVFATVAAGQAPPDLETQKAQANAVADMLQAVRGVNLQQTATARMSDGQGVDLYL